MLCRSEEAFCSLVPSSPAIGRFPRGCRRSAPHFLFLSTLSRYQRSMSFQDHLAMSKIQRFLGNLQGTQALLRFLSPFGVQDPRSSLFLPLFSVRTFPSRPALLSSSFPPSSLFLSFRSSVFPTLPVLVSLSKSAEVAIHPSRLR